LGYDLRELIDYFVKKENNIIFTITLYSTNFWSYK